MPTRNQNMSIDGSDLGSVEEFPYLRPLNAISEQMDVRSFLIFWDCEQEFNFKHQNRKS